LSIQSEWVRGAERMSFSAGGGSAARRWEAVRRAAAVAAAVRWRKWRRFTGEILPVNARAESDS
jgi:hypothetical protein